MTLIMLLSYINIYQRNTLFEDKNYCISAVAKNDYF